MPAPTHCTAGMKPAKADPSALYLLSSQDIALMSDEQVIAFHRNYRPMRLTRCDWRQHPNPYQTSDTPA